MQQHSNIHSTPSFYLEKCIENRKRLLEHLKSTNINKQSLSSQENSEQLIESKEPPLIECNDKDVQLIQFRGNSHIQEQQIQKTLESNQCNKKKILIQYKFKTKLSQQIKSNELSNLFVEHSIEDITNQNINQNQRSIQTQTDLLCTQEHLGNQKPKIKVNDNECQTTEDVSIQSLIIQKMKEDALKPNKKWYSINLNPSIHNKLLMSDRFMQNNKVAIDYFESLKNQLDES